MQVTKSGSTKVTLGLVDEVFWIFTPKSTLGKYDHMLLTWVRQINAIAEQLVPQRLSNWAKANVAGYVARLSAGSVGGHHRVKDEPA